MGKSKLPFDASGDAFVSIKVARGIHSAIAGVNVRGARVQAEWSDYNSDDYPSMRRNAAARLEAALLRALDDVRALQAEINTEGK